MCGKIRVGVVLVCFKFLFGFGVFKREFGVILGLFCSGK